MDAASGGYDAAGNPLSIAPPRPERGRKRLKLEQKPPATTDIAKLRQQICDHKRKCQEELKEAYRDNLAELFFLQNGLNIMDFSTWRKKTNVLLNSYLRTYSLDKESEEAGDSQLVKKEPYQSASADNDSNDAEYRPQGVKRPLSLSHRPEQSGDGGSQPMTDSQPASSEAIVEQARKEAQVMQRVAELRKQGLWSSKRLPKVQEPQRAKAHWDYLLEEMQWLAADFAQERKWKRAGCRKISRMVMRYHQEKLGDEKKAEKEESAKLRRIAGQIAKQIKDFWNNVEKVVQYKYDSRLDEKRRHALDVHLNFIVDQTEKYSSWLSSGLTGPATASTSNSKEGSVSTASPKQDIEFEPMSASSDDEETIAKEEELSATDHADTDAEVAALQAESEMPLDELIASLPSEILEKPATTSSEDNESDGSRAASSEEFDGEVNDAMDDEETLVEQEEHEEKDYDNELQDLKDEGELTVEELAAKYAGAYSSDIELPYSPSSTEVESADDSNDETSSDEEEDTAAKHEEGDEEEKEIGMEYLLHPEKEDPGPRGDGDAGDKREITDIAAAAQMLQPTGYTLETTVVKTPIPFLLKHTLREYQHVGLDWLATMYEKKLNGILADEMGLGKTIQTIALLAHLAGEHGIWGPHLIVVPTSVMLNWEMEIKKWCPGFKILTYYGTPKERKMKRIGWTKTNAFHVCITSYRLVIQDHNAFRRKKWRYLILDEAQNIKNFKSQRWQTLLNFSSQRRLLLTGTPLQNNLMELWSLMHFLMPNVFQSHMEFKEWFANPLTGMIEGTSDYNEQLVRRLHKVLRPFLLRRLKADVEKQLPKKYEHVVLCNLSKRQRFLYDEFMSRRATKDTLANGHFMSVINILMQLRKVCNHPDMFDPRPIVSPFETEPLSMVVPANVLKSLEYEPLQHINLRSLSPSIADLELSQSAYAAHRSRELQISAQIIESMDDLRDTSPRPPPTKLRPFVIRSPTPSQQKPPSTSAPPITVKQAQSAISITSSLMRPTSAPAGSIKVLGKHDVRSSSSLSGQLTSLVSSAKASPGSKTAGQPITLQIQQGPRGATTKLLVPPSQLSNFSAGLVHIIQTATGPHLITAGTKSSNAVSTSSSIGRIIPISSVTVTGVGGTTQKPHSTTASPVASIDPATGKPVLRVAPLTAAASLTQSSPSSSNVITLSASLPSGLSRTASSTSSTSTSGSGQLARAISVPNGSLSAVKPVSAVRAAIPSIGKPGKSSQLLGPASRKRALETEARNKFETELKLDLVSERKAQWRLATLKRLMLMNKQHCSRRPVYGSDLHSAVDVWSHGLHATSQNFLANSAVYCRTASQPEMLKHPYWYWNSTNHLQSLILNGAQRLQQLKGVIERFVFATPPVKTLRTSLSASCRSSLVNYDELVSYASRRQLSEVSTMLHPVQTRMLVQFPEKRLIQYDCGKLQTLDILLRELKQGQHRVLIFTQMTRMLDVLEAFLNYHGYRYLRLDGTTKVEMRQALMDRFNADPKIFVFILSTRSGGIGVNLTGADTVVFYDSDWNPTMDAQAQDRCHRIGQTRDVHIYRLVSERTVEENILKKANQKRLLGDVAIEGGSFTTATLQQGTITDLFAEPSGLTSLVESKGSTPGAPVPQSLAPMNVTSVAPNLNEKQFEQALGQAEDDEDVKAAAIASEEAGAELAEFDENIPWDEREAELSKQQKESTSKVEMEIALIEKELTPVERYAMSFLELTDDQFSEEAVRQAEMDIEQAKRDWELNRLKQQREEEERRAELEEDDMLYTYSKEDSMNQAFKDSVTGENMPMWCPPTPPRLENDVYVDQCMSFMYDTAVMTESQLPPVYVKKEKKRPREASSHGVIPRKKSRMSEDVVPQLSSTSRPPRSLFDRPSTAMLKIRREKGMLRHPAVAGALMKLGPGASFQKTPQPDSGHQDQPEWLIHEDWSLLQAVQTLLQLPLNLAVMSPAHIPNWDLVSDIVSTTSRIYRSPKQCKLRYENIIIPREEGKLFVEANPRKQQKKPPKSLYKKSNKPMKTGHMYNEDSGSSVTTLHAFRFDCIKNVASKRTPTLRPTLVNPTMKNPKHTAVISESGIQYENPLNPEEVAKIRQDRIKNDKIVQAEQQQQRTTQSAVARAASLNSPGVQLQQLTASGATAIISPAQKPALTRTSLPGSIVVNTPGNSFSAINRRLSGQTTNVITGVTSVTRASTTGGQQKIHDVSQLRGNLLQKVQAGTATSVPRTITVQQQQQTLSLSQAKTIPHLSHLNLVKQQHGQRTAGSATLVAQRASAASQLLTNQQTVVASVPTLVKTVSSASAGAAGSVALPVTAGAININVSLAQQKALSAAQQGAAAGKTNITANPQQYRQILLNRARPLTQQKIGVGLAQVNKGSGASVQIVQQKIGGVQQKIGVHHIQQLIKQQQQQSAQIIATPANTSVSGGQTIIGTTQLITPANMHATITKMSNPTASGASNITGTLARPLVTATSTVAIVPGTMTTASLVQSSQSKVVGASVTRMPASAVAHRIAGAISGTSSNIGSAAGGSASLNLVTVHNQTSSSSASKSSSISAVNTSQPSSSGTAILQAKALSAAQSSSAVATVLQQTILSNRQPSATTSASVVTTGASVSPSPTIISASSLTPVVAFESVSAVTVESESTTTTSTVVEPQSSPRSSSPEQSTSVQDSTRTYAMRPRKNN